MPRLPQPADGAIWEAKQKGEVMINLGQVAYEAYGDSRGWRVFSGDQMPSWDEQVPELREAWEAAAQAVVEATHQ